MKINKILKIEKVNIELSEEEVKLLFNILGGLSTYDIINNYHLKESHADFVECLYNDLDALFNREIKEK
ncbi:MAG: hypothetical protein WC554_15815 [Clostridia bacterium]|jgi:hypothetical protein